MSSSKPATKRRHVTETSSSRSKKPRGEEQEEVAQQEPWDFSQWAWQDTKKAPLPSAASSGGPVVRWLGVQSLASIVLRRDGKVLVVDAVSKRGLQFDMGYVEGLQREAHVVLPLAAPRAVAALFSSKVAKEVLETPSFLQRLCEAGGQEPSLRQSIAEVLAELNIFSPEEHEKLVSFFKICGGTEEGKLPLRAARVQGQLVLALVDAVMLAKKCPYKTAQSICRRLLLDYWQLDMEELARSEGTSVSPQILPVRFHAGRKGGDMEELARSEDSSLHPQIFPVRLQRGSNGGQATVCVTAAFLAEVLVLIPGCELSSQLRKDMVRSFFGVGGSEVTFEGLLANPRIQGHLRGCAENPLAEVLQDHEQRELVRSFPGILQTLQKSQEELQLALDTRHEELQLALGALESALGRRDEQLLTRLAQQCEQLSLGVVFAMQRSVSAALQPLLQSLQPLGELLGSLRGLSTSVALSVRGAVKDVIDAAVTSADSKLVKAFRAATKAPTKRSSADAAKFPASQRATPKQKLEALSLAKVAYEEFPRRDLHYNTWKCVRSEFGKRCKAERLRRHGLAVASPDFEPQPLLWCTGLLDGCKERYLYLEQHRALLRAVWHHKPPFGRSLQDWAVELQAAAAAETGYVEVEWPEDAAEHEVFG
jgi:hypothetical protein